MAVTVSLRDLRNLPMDTLPPHDVERMTYFLGGVNYPGMLQKFSIMFDPKKHPNGKRR